METTPSKPYSRREIVIIILIIIVAALAIGNFNSTVTTVQSTSSGLLTISLNAICNGFGEPTYWGSLDPDLSFTTYRYGHCLFGFWVSNGQQVGGSGEAGLNFTAN